MSSKKLLVYLDMDGVLVDWLNGMRESYGKPESFYDEFVANPDTLNEDAISKLFDGEANLRKIMRDWPPEAWLNLKMFPWADDLINAIRARYEVVFFTSPGENPNAASGKILWQQKYYPTIPIFIGKHKHLAASENKVLVDDTEKKLMSFKSFGGGVVLWPNQFYMLKKSAEEMEETVNRTVYAIECHQVTYGLRSNCADFRD